MAIIDGAMTSSRLSIAQLHVYNVCQTGKEITLFRPGTGTKDEFGTVTSGEESLVLHSFPTRLSPYPRKVYQEISWSEDTDIVCYVSVREITLIPITIDKLRRYKRLEVGGLKYDLKYIDYYSPFADSYLYVIIGGKK